MHCLQERVCSTDIEGNLYTHTGLPYPEGALPVDPTTAYSATSLASASLLYSSWFAQTKPGQLFGLQGKSRSAKRSGKTDTLRTCFLIRTKFLEIFQPFGKRDSLPRKKVRGRSRSRGRVRYSGGRNVSPLAPRHERFLSLSFSRRERITTTKNSNYYPLVITYRRNSIFANNGSRERCARWAAPLSRPRRILDITRGACSNSFSTREAHISGPVAAAPCFRRVIGGILDA